MKRVTEEKLGEPSFCTTDRTTLKQDIRTYYLGKTESNIGIGLLLSLKNGRLSNPYGYAPHYCRLDYLQVYYATKGKRFQVNAWVDPNGHINIQPELGCILSHDETELIRRQVAEWKAAHAEFVAIQEKWGREAPVTVANVTGMTPAEAIAWLTKRGW